MYNQVDIMHQEKQQMFINYTRGELIEIIDSEVTLEIDKLGKRWMVSVLIFDFTGTELINCLFDACVKLKEEGVI